VGVKAGKPLRWRLKLRVNRLLRRNDGYCWWCGARWDGQRCARCGMALRGSGIIKGFPITEDDLPKWARELFNRGRRSA
jgi:hypothetical protein